MNHFKRINRFVFLMLAFLAFSNSGTQAASKTHRDLLHTNANIARLKNQIKTDPEVKQAWGHQLQRAENLRVTKYTRKNHWMSTKHNQK